MIPEYFEMRRKLATDYDRPEPMPRPVLAARCPHCKVAPGGQCVEPASGKTLRHTQAHPARWKAAGYEMPTPRVPAGLLSREQGSPGVSGTPGAHSGSTGLEAVAS